MTRTRRLAAGIVAAGLALAWAGAGAGSPPAREPATDEALVLPRPPFTDTYRGKAPGALTSLRLVKLSERRNQITDTEAWFRENRLSLPVVGSDLPDGDRGKIPEEVPASFAGQRLIRAIRSGERLLLIYGRDFSVGRYVVAWDPVKKERLYALDFRNYLEPPAFAAADRELVNETVQWAAEADGLLYVSTFHNTYAKSSRGMNGYLTALEPRTGTLRWRSRPLVCNTENFVLQGDALICGYGFTAEPDYLYVLDRRTGRIAQTVKVRSGPEYVIPRDGRLYVRTYDTDYVFRIRR